jgi:hypothetical protein
MVQAWQRRLGDKDMELNKCYQCGGFGCDHCVTPEPKNDISKLKAEIKRLKNLLRLARDEYIELNSDGIHDCVTPYDIYT